MKLRVPRQLRLLLKGYENALRRADQLARKEARKGKGSTRLESRKLPKRYWAWLQNSRSESAYEHALEILRDQIETSPGIVAYLDRPYSDDTATLEPEGVPRPIWSRSPYALGCGKPKRAKCDLLASALLESRDKLDALRETDGCKGAGIGTAPVTLGIEDQWIFAYGKWRLV